MPQQSPDLSLTEQVAFSTVRIEVEFDGQKGFGTGFFFALLKDGDNSVPVIVTNKHVVQGAKRGQFILTQANPDGSPNLTSHIPVVLDKFESRWIFHPDSSVDLAVMPMAGILNQALAQQFKPFFRTLDKSLIPKPEQLKQLTAVEDILMVGYPVGILDSVNNYPVFRKGITATHPANNYEGRDEFMIDAACFPGSSGSPVFLLNLGSYPGRQGGLVVGNRFLFLGILYGGPQFTATGEIRITTIPHRQDMIAVTAIPINLGNVIRSNRIMDFEPLIKKFMTKP